MRGPGNDDDAVVYCGSPGVGAAPNGDIVLVYQTRGASTYPGGALQRRTAEADLRGSRTFHEGKLSTALSVHYAGIALDPDLGATGVSGWPTPTASYQAAGGRIAVGRVKP